MIHQYPLGVRADHVAPDEPIALFSNTPKDKFFYGYKVIIPSVKEGQFKIHEMGVMKPDGALIPFAAFDVPKPVSEFTEHVEGPTFPHEILIEQENRFYIKVSNITEQEQVFICALMGYADDQPVILGVHNIPPT